MRPDSRNEKRFSEYRPSPFYAPGTVLGSGDSAVKRKGSRSFWPP